MAISTPDAVPGEVIEAAWGDAVRADLTGHETKLNTLLADTGWLSGSANTGYSGTFQYRRFGPVVVATFYLTRTGGNLVSSASNVATIIDVPSRPGIIIRGVARITSPTDALAFEIQPAGVLAFTALTINTNGVVIGGAAWMVTP